MKNLFNTMGFALLIFSMSTVDASSFCPHRHGKKCKKPNITQTQTNNQVVNVINNNNDNEDVLENFSVIENPFAGETETLVVFDQPEGDENAFRTNALTPSASFLGLGTLFPFSNPLYLVSDTNYQNSIGSDNGHCILTKISDCPAGEKGSLYNCTWTNSFDGTGGIPQGSIMVSGPFSDYGVSTLAIIGGTGAFEGAKGHADVIPIFRDSQGNVIPNVGCTTEGVDYSLTTYRFDFFFK